MTALCNSTGTVGGAFYAAVMNTETARIDTMATASLDLFIAAVDQVPAQGWDRASNLASWTVRELVAHATGSAAKIVTLVADGQLWGPSEPSDWMYEDPAARLRELAGQLAHALPGADLDAPRSAPEGSVPLHRALAYPVSDLALHSWDLHRSQGRFVELPEDVLTFCRGLVESVPQHLLRRPGGFGPARAAPVGATPTTELMAFLGRSVDTPG